MPAARDVWTAALAYEGVRWVHQGRRKDGVDCLGLIIMVAIDLGLEGAERFTAVDMRNYARLPQNKLAAELVAAGCTRSTTPALGMIGLFAQPGTYPIHFGIFGDGDMIHGLAGAKKVVRHGYVDPWPSQLRGVFAYPGIDYGV